MIHSVIFLVGGFVSIAIASRMYPFNKPEFHVFDSVYGNHKRGTQVAGLIMIGYAIVNMIWPA
jgi:hypothetical protein